MPDAPTPTGTVHFIGAGPGAADLLTLRAARLLAVCEVCVYAARSSRPPCSRTAPRRPS